jgi:ribosome-binding protein aMBF1 (putative translation factor)
MKTKDGQNLLNTSRMIADKYGEHGSEKRTEFNAKSLAWYYGELLRDRRKALHITQKALAQKIGKKQSYIAKIEKDETDLQLSSFIQIAKTLGYRMLLAEDISY